MKSSRLVLVAVGASLSATLPLGAGGCKSQNRTEGTAEASVATTAAAGGDTPRSHAQAPAERPPTSHAASTDGPWFVTSDGRYGLSAPGWRMETSSDQRNVLRIERGSKALNLYEEKKVDFEATNIDEFLATELALKRKANQAPEVPIASITVGGHTARQVEVNVVMNGAKWRELLTVIEFPQEYLEASMVVKPSEYDKDTIVPIVQTIEAVDAK